MKNSLKKKMTLCLSALCLSAFAFGAGLTSFETASAETALVTLEDGARCKVKSEESSGLQFEGAVDATQFETLKETATNVEAGIIIVPTDYVAKTGAYTLEALETAYGEGKIAYATYSETADFVQLSDGASYGFYLNIKVLEENYARYFTGIAFVRMTPTDESAVDAEIFDEYGDTGVYYTYATATPSRSVYEVAKLAYEDRAETLDGEYKNEVTTGGVTNYSKLTGTQLTIAEKYVSKVAEVVYDGEGAASLYDVKYYDESYALTASGEDYLLSGEPTHVVYSGAAVTQFPIQTPNGNYIHKQVTSGATLGENNAATIDAAILTGAGYAFQAIDVENGYVAFEGDYGVGTYVDFYFTGNNMPQVMFFADVINGNMTNFTEHNYKKATANYEATNSSAEVKAEVANYTGLLFSNGMACSSNTSTNTNGARNYFSIWGMNRMNFANVATTYGASANLNTAVFKAKYADGGAYNAFTQVGLSTDYATTEFKYTVGTYNTDGMIAVEAILYTYDQDNSTWTQLAAVSQKTEYAAADYSGNIVAYGTVKGEETAFTYSTPYADFAGARKGATYNADGSVTLTGTQLGSTAGYACFVSDLENSYVAFDGNYGVGTYVDFYFTGNNLPQLMLFADKIDGKMAGFTYTGTNGAAVLTENGAKGILLSNGFFNHATSNVNNGGKNSFAIWGPNRYTPAALNNAYAYLLGGSLYAKTAASVYGTAQTATTVTGAAASVLSQTSLASDTYANQKFKYTVGTYSEDGYMVVDITLYTIGAEGDLTVVTNILCKTTIADTMKGSIVAYATVKGTGENTTFSYSAPYEKE